jgi:Holliday junction resolvase-like predicted endonuclease
MTNALTNDDCRFDCILMNGTSGNDIEWLRDAFSLD